VRGYVVVFEGDNSSGYSAYSPDLTGVVAVGETRTETERLMREAMAEHSPTTAEQRPGPRARRSRQRHYPLDPVAA